MIFSDEPRQLGQRIGTVTSSLQSRGTCSPLRAKRASQSKRAVVRHTLNLVLATIITTAAPGRRRWPSPRRIPGIPGRSAIFNPPARSTHLVGAERRAKGSAPGRRTIKTPCTKHEASGSISGSFWIMRRRCRAFLTQFRWAWNWLADFPVSHRRCGAAHGHQRQVPRAADRTRGRFTESKLARICEARWSGAASSRAGSLGRMDQQAHSRLPRVRNTDWRAGVRRIGRKTPDCRATARSPWRGRNQSDRVVLAVKHHEAHGVPADFVHHLSQRHELPCPLRHFVWARRRAET